MLRSQWNSLVPCALREVRPELMSPNGERLLPLKFH